MKEKLYINRTLVRNDYLRDVVKKLVEQRQKLRITQEELNARLGMADRFVSNDNKFTIVRE